MKELNLELLVKYRRECPVRYLIKKFQVFIESHTSNYIRCAVISVKNDMLITASDDSKVMFWSLLRFIKVDELSVRTFGFWSITLSKDENVLVAGTRDCRIIAWNLVKRELMFDIRAHEMDVFRC
jgi:WD40 repeat protein